MKISLICCVFRALSQYVTSVTQLMHFFLKSNITANSHLVNHFWASTFLPLIMSCGAEFWLEELDAFHVAVYQYFILGSQGLRSLSSECTSQHKSFIPFIFDAVWELACSSVCWVTYSIYTGKGDIVLMTLSLIHKSLVLVTGRGHFISAINARSPLEIIAKRDFSSYK